MGIGRDIVYAAGLAAASPVWATAMLRTGKWRTDWAGRFGRVDPPAANGGAKRLLICAVSVGEVNSIKDLVAQLADPEAGGGVEVVIATTTNTGFERATKLYGARHRVVRYPLDFTFAVSRFLDAVRPDAVALVELEVWPNFVDACEARGVPVAVINGRLSDRSFPRYRKARPLLRGTFTKLAAAAMQTPAYAERIIEMGVPPDRVHVLDTMKWDTAQVTDNVPGSTDLAWEMGIDPSRPVVVLGSTGDGEERPLVDAVRGACGEAVQIVVVPRKPERFNDVAGMFPGIVRRTRTRARTQTQTPTPTPTSSAADPAGPQGDSGRAAGTSGERTNILKNVGTFSGQESGQLPGDLADSGGDAPAAARGRHTNILKEVGTSSPPLFLLDTLGELKKAYALADVVIVGRSFNGWGGSDPIESVALGKATITGPDTSNFRDAVTALRDGGGLLVAADPAEAAAAAARLLADPAERAGLAKRGRDVILSRQGATRRHAELLRGLLQTHRSPQAASG